MPRHLFIDTSNTKILFGVVQAISYLGSFLALASGVSLLLLLQFLLDFVPDPSWNTNSKLREIPTIKTRTSLHVVSEKLGHLVEHVRDFIKMSSIHGVRNLSGDLRKKIVWLAFISAATWGSAHFVYKTVKDFSENAVITELADRTWSVNEVFF